MESSESEAVIDWIPQLFVNETLNTVDDLVDDAFHFYHQSASTLLNADAACSSQYLAQRIDRIRSKIQSDLDVRLRIWEKYCLHHCFTVPKNFTLPKTVGRDSAELKRELEELERQSASSDRCATVASEALKQYEQNSFQDVSRPGHRKGDSQKHTLSSG